MELTFQLIDCDYILLNNSPVIRMFGKSTDGKTVCSFLEGYYPYFYLLPKDGAESKAIEFLKAKFSNLVLNISRVEKFMPIGYNTQRKEILLIKVRDPSQVPLIRDELLRQNFVQEIFEADILFKYRFMTDYDLAGMKWFKVTGDPVSTTTVKADKIVKAQKIEKVDNTETNLRYMAIDIEVATETETLIDPKNNPISMISIAFSQPFEGKDNMVLVAKRVKSTEKNISQFKDETEMLKEFTEIIDRFDPDVITGYNINGFDFPYIVERLVAAKVSRTIGRCKQTPAISKKFGNYYRNVIRGRIIADSYDLIKESASKGFLRLKRYGLGDVSKALLGEGKADVAHGEISKFWNGDDGQITKLIEYARKDSQLALRLLIERRMLDKFFELTKLSGLLMQDALDGGESNRVESLLLKEFNRRDYVLPLKPQSNEILRRKEMREAKGLKGALVLEPKMGLHTNPIVYLDFKAMYPSIFISYNICPTTLMVNNDNVEHMEAPNGAKFVSKKVQDGIIPKIVKHLIEERDIVRGQMKKTEDESMKRVLDAKQYALKVMANSFYGYTGYVRARLYILDIANAITSCGRFLIQKTRDIVESDKNFEVIYGDTDSIMVKTNTNSIEEASSVGKTLESKINTALSGIVQMKIEDVFMALLILSKKRYAGLTLEKINGEYKEHMVMKGIETIRRDWCDLTSETLYTVLQIMLKEGDPKKAVKYVKNILSDLDKNKIPIEKLVVTKSVSKPLREYKGVQPHIELLKKLRKRSPAEAPGIGDRIGYVIIQGMQLMSDRAEDPEYVKANKLKVDSKYYMESQLLPPLERVFEAIGIGKSDLVNVGKQMLLLDSFKKIENNKVQQLNSFDSFVCEKCNNNFSRPPLAGKCKCGGEILFSSGGLKSSVIA